MEIKILGHRKALIFLQEHPKEYDVLFVSSPDSKFAIPNSHLIQNLAKEYCEVLFHDVTQAIGLLEPAQPHHIQKAIEFGRNKEKLLVCCQAGVSRSSALAYSIKTTEVGPKEALSILDQQIHMPNGLIIKYASNILNQPDMVDIVDTWKFTADQIQMETENSLT